MKRLVTPAVAAVGAVLAGIGIWWLWTGLDIVQVERGWATVIAGATMLSAGVILMAIAAVLMRLVEIARALAQQPVAAPLADHPMPLAEAAPPSPPHADPLPSHSVPSQPEQPRMPPPRPSPQPEPPPVQTPGSTVVKRQVVGNTTYVMFADGSVEAQTPEGVVTFESMDALHDHVEARAPSAATLGLRP